MRIFIFVVAALTVVATPTAAADRTYPIKPIRLIVPYPPGGGNALNREIVKGINSPDMKTFLANMGVEPAGTTPQEFAAFIKSELVKWAKVVKASGARAD